MNYDLQYHRYVIREFLSLIGYLSWWERSAVRVQPGQLAGELLAISVDTIEALMCAITYLRGELILSGYDLRGFEILNRDPSVISALLKQDAYFSLQGYLFDSRFEPELIIRDFPIECIKDLLYQIDYQAAIRTEWVKVSPETVARELRRLPLSSLLSLYEALLNERDCWFGGYEINGFHPQTRPLNDVATAARELIL